MTLLDVMRDASSGFRGSLGASVKHLGTGENASLNGDEVFPSASVRKIAIIAEAYRQAEGGAFSLDATMVLRHEDKVPGTGVLRELSPGLELTHRDLISLMMILSDNTATDYIMCVLGREKINANLERLGLERTRIVAGSRAVLFDMIGLDDLPEEEKTIDVFRGKSRGARLAGSWSAGTRYNNVTTPREMLRLVESIVRCNGISEESSRAILETMSRCQTGANRIPKYLPMREVEVAHKTGSLPGVRNDAGLITLLDTGERYILSCFTNEAVDDFEAEEVIAKVSKSVYDYFTGKLVE
jgi:beta-lactamase class A